MRDECQIQNSDGSHRTYACRSHCERMVREKILRRLPRSKGTSPRYQLIKYPAPSNSAESAACVTLSDMQVIAGLQKASVLKIERLIGFGILPESTRMVPQYL